jgi:hypothetical protein
MSDHPIPSAPSERDNTMRRRGYWLLASLLGIAVLGLAWIRSGWHRESETPRETFALPPISSSPFLNTAAQVRYVGSESCRACHEARTASFRATGMGRSMAGIDPALEPPDAVFDHALSKRRYQVRRKDGQLWHRELLLHGGPEEMVLSEYPLKYVVGSGWHARTYAVEAEGFLVESPLSWYASGKSWGMSPGYDRPDHMSFERGIGENCLICHAGHAEAIDNSMHRMKIHEAAISCERCHGPGSLHVDLHTAKPGSANQLGDIDHTIVNPVHLSRELAEAVCQQCHLRGAATVLGRGRKLTDYRPGLPLQDFRQDYWLEVDNAPMTVVGHVEQMHLSRCYKESETLTCTSCHNPHAFPRPEERVAYYRARCLRCHDAQDCKVPSDQLTRESPSNDCVHCHMPSGDTEVPHVSFTHHRIGLHDKRSSLPADDDRIGTLRLFFENTRLGALDAKRSLGLAYLELAMEKKSSGRGTYYRRQGFELLSEVHAAGLPDPIVRAKLARMHFELEQDQAMPLAQSALADETLTALERCAALFVLGAERLRHKRYDEARIAFRELVTLRRHPHDWLLLAQSERGLGNKIAFQEAHEMAARINPKLGKAP